VEKLDTKSGKIRHPKSPSVSSFYSNFAFRKKQKIKTVNNLKFRDL